MFFFRAVIRAYLTLNSRIHFWLSRTFFGARFANLEFRRFYWHKKLDTFSHLFSLTRVTTRMAFTKPVVVQISSFMWAWA